MIQVFRLMLLLAGLLAACALAGCAADNRVSPQAAQPAPAPFVRADHVCASLGQGQADVAAIKADLVKILSRTEGGATANVVYDPEGKFYEYAGAANVSESGFAVKHLRLNYAELMDRRVVHKSYDKQCDTIAVAGVMSFSFCNREQAKCVAEELFAIQKDLRTQYVNGQLARFQPFLDEYRAMKVKPQVTEEQRKYFVGASTLAQKKEYAQAVELYGKALNINRFSFPAAYYNMALIFSQMGKYQSAIVGMKIYLLMAPEAEDARSAQDKIYEWEALSGGQ